MKKDFSQPFKILPAHLSVIVQDDASKKYALLRSQEEWEEEFCSVFTPKLDDRPVVVQIVQYLNGHGFNVTTVRELARQTEVSYSFADDTPGSMSDSICMLAVVNRTDRDKDVIEDQKVEWVSVGGLNENLHASPYLTPIVELGLKRLLAEDDY